MKKSISFSTESSGAHQPGKHNPRIPRKGILLTAAALTAAISLTACSQTAIPDTLKIEQSTGKVISVDSSQSMKVTPDMAEIQLEVYSQAADAMACQQQNNQDLSQVLTALKDAGVGADSIQTSAYGLNPIYNWDNGKTLTGYEMSTTVTVSDLPIDQAGAILTASVNAGAGTIKSVDYLSSQFDATYNEALKQAIETAKTKAEAIAAASGCTLGDITHVQELTSNTEARYNSYAAAGGQRTESVADMSVMPGQVDVEAKVTVEFSITAP